MCTRRLVGRATASLLSGDPQRLLYPGDDALVRVEELVVDLVPAAELVDREQVRRRRELGLVDERLLDRAVTLLLEDPLPCIRAQERDEVLSPRPRSCWPT
jgi:hypothetical protein